MSKMPKIAKIQQSADYLENGPNARISKNAKNVQNAKIAQNAKLTK